jgi:hypothetical protein
MPHLCEFTWIQGWSGRISARPAVSRWTDEHYAVATAAMPVPPASSFAIAGSRSWSGKTRDWRARRSCAHLLCRPTGLQPARPWKAGPRPRSLPASFLSSADDRAIRVPGLRSLALNHLSRVWCDIWSTPLSHVHKTAAPLRNPYLKLSTRVRSLSARVITVNNTQRSPGETAIAPPPPATGRTPGVGIGSDRPVARSRRVTSSWPFRK